MTNDGNDGQHVGRGRPPVATRFKKGTSGNPSGRPKRSPTFKSDFAAELSEEVEIVDRGKKLRMTKQRALIRTLIAAAIDNEAPAISAVLAYLKLFGLGSEDSSPDAVDQDDLEILGNFLERQGTNPITETNEDTP